MMNDLFKRLDYYVPLVRCELNYSKDYELLIATVLSAQCTDKRVNIVTKDLFSKYDINTLADANIKVIENVSSLRYSIFVPKQSQSEFIPRVKLDSILVNNLKLSNLALTSTFISLSSL